MSCTSEKDYDEQLSRQINKAINSYSNLNLIKNKSWFPSSTYDRNTFPGFDINKWAAGFLPAELVKHLWKEQKVPKANIVGCIERLDQITKWNRYNKYKSKRFHDRTIRTINALKGAISSTVASKAPPSPNHVSWEDVSQQNGQPKGNARGREEILRRTVEGFKISIRI